MTNFDYNVRVQPLSQEGLQILLDKETDKSKVLIFNVEDVFKERRWLADNLPEPTNGFYATLIILRDKHNHIKIIKNRFTIQGGIFKLID